jgi:hypothetical protein
MFMSFRFAMSILAFVALTTNAHAYLDPGTGSIILQAVVAGVASSMFVVRMYWNKLRGFLGIGANKDKDGAGSA